ncbi:polyprenyl synthetase family protein [Candidatus Bipolaricaulota bacterium]|nr:polyprenyl synthetase family protein [Candidatus Bipolaricaulota bacterium]
MTHPRILLRYTSLIEEGLFSALQGDSLLYTILRYHMGLEDGRGVQARGKLLRSRLLLFTAEELGTDPETALPGALALEFVHNFSLIHDDIQDNDAVRRGQQTVWLRYGIGQAINAGDLMQGLAVAQAALVGEDAVVALVEATMEMIEGQALDLAFEREKVGTEPYLGMIDKKTGALIRAAFRLGGLLAGAAADVVKDLVELGQDLGRVFQIRDDMLGIWGDGTETGKPHGSDIRRRKKSLPIVIAMADAAGNAIGSATGDERVLLQEIYAKKTIDDADVKRVIDVLDRLNVHQECEEQVNSHLNRADERIAALPFSQQGREEIRELIDYLARRER